MKVCRWFGLFVVLAALLAAFPARAQQTARPVSIGDLFALRDVRDPQISPDGKWVAYTVGILNRDLDKNRERVWMIPAGGGEAIALTSEDESSSHARWSPDGKFVAFLSGRSEGPTQVWLLNRLGGEAQKLTNTPQSVEDFAWAPDSKRMVLVLRDPKAEEVEEAANRDKEKSGV